MTAWYVELGGSDVTHLVKPGSLTWTTKEGEELDTASFVLDDRAGELGFLSGASAVELGTEGGALFGGQAVKLTPRGDPTGQWLSWQIDAEGQEVLVNATPRQRITYLGQAPGVIVADLFTKAGLTPEFNVVTYVETGPTIDVFSATGETLTKMLDRLAIRASMAWYIDASKNVHFAAEDSVGEAALIGVIAPGTLANHALGIYEIEAGSLEVQLDARDLVNRVTMDGGYGLSAPVTDTFAGSDKYGTEIGWAFNLTGQNMATAPLITWKGAEQVVGTAWVDYFGKTLADGRVVDVIVSRANGVLYFDLDAEIEDGDAITVQYQVNEKKSLTLDASNSAASAASYARYGRYFDGELGWRATDEAEALSIGEAYIGDHGFEVVSGSFAVKDQLGLRAGQHITITAALYNLSGSYPIRQVTNELLTNMMLRSTVNFGGRSQTLSNALDSGEGTVVEGPIYGEATQIRLSGIFEIGDPATEFVP